MINRLRSPRLPIHCIQPEASVPKTKHTNVNFQKPVTITKISFKNRCRAVKIFFLHPLLLLQLS